MLSPALVNLLANIGLVVGFITLGTSISMQLAGDASRETMQSAYQRASLGGAYASGMDALELTAPPMFTPAAMLAPHPFSSAAANAAFAHPVAAAAPNIEEMAGAARLPAAPVEARLAALPAEAGLMFEDIGRKFCIGGTQCAEHCALEAGGCEVKPAYVIRLERPAYISAVQVYAHDQVGATRRASLLVKVDGIGVGRAPVHRFGSTRTVKVDRVGQLVTIESMHDTHGFLHGGEEAVIWDVYLFGREPR